MRVKALVVVATLLSAFGSQSYGEPAEQPGIAFSFPYQCSSEENDKKMHIGTLCLSDSFPSGLKLVLVGKNGNCSAKTANTFTDENAGNEFKATHLSGTENCLTDHDNKAYRIAVVGVDASAVYVEEPKTDHRPLPKDIELKARKTASSGYKSFSTPSNPVVDVADSSPDVFTVGDTAFLLFKCTDDFFNQDGLPVLVLKSSAFLLEGSCAFRSPFFFSVREKLYVSYWATVSCCGCGDSNFFVYDLSGESPILVYENSNFSD